MNKNFKTFFRKDSSSDSLASAANAATAAISSSITSSIIHPMQIMILFNSFVKKNPFFGFILISLGVALTASAGGWDITNHLLNKPETFFSPPHAALYTGVVIVIFGSVMIYRSRHSYYTISHDSNNKNNSNRYIDNLIHLPLSIKAVTIGVVMLVSAGPFDFAWHSAFGLDGLLSPPHVVLTVGMVLSSIGALLGILSTNNDLYYNNNKKESSKLKSSTVTDSSSISDLNSINNTSPIISPIIIVFCIIPIWLTISGLIHVMTLPFSDTQYFKFNPDPILAAIIATLAFPFIVSFILFSSFGLYGNSINNNRATTRTKKTTKQARMLFGIVSITGTGFIIINLATTILPNEYLIPTIPFYILNIIPIVSADVLLSKLSIGTNNNRVIIANYAAGALLGLTFFTLYYPLVTHTYNEVLTNPNPVWPSLTSSIYFKMIVKLYPLVIVPAMITGILGMLISSKLIHKPAQSMISK